MTFVVGILTSMATDYRYICDYLPLNAVNCPCCRCQLLDWVVLAFFARSVHIGVLKRYFPWNSLTYSCTQIHMRHLLPHVLSWHLTKIYTHDITLNLQINFKKKMPFINFASSPLFGRAIGSPLLRPSISHSSFPRPGIQVMTEESPTSWVVWHVIFKMTISMDSSHLNSSTCDHSLVWGH